LKTIIPTDRKSSSKFSTITVPTIDTTFPNLYIKSRDHPRYLLSISPYQILRPRIWTAKCIVNGECQRVLLEAREYSERQETLVHKNTQALCMLLRPSKDPAFCLPDVVGIFKREHDFVSYSGPITLSVAHVQPAISLQD